MKKKSKTILVFLLLVILYISSIYFSKEMYYYNSSKSFMTYVVYAMIALTIVLMVVFTIAGFKTIKNYKKKKKSFFVLIILVILGQLFIGYNLNRVSGVISNLTSGESYYSSSIVVLKDSNINKIKDIKTFGIISDEDNIEGYIIPMQMVSDKKISKNKLISYDSFIDMIHALYNKEIDAMFISSSYVSMFANQEGFETLANDTKIIDSKKKPIEKTKTSKKLLTEPFTVLIMGVDEDEEAASGDAFNGDTLMLITFNPKTMNATILSIPRDTRVPIVCVKGKPERKINSAAYNGTKCVTDTITNFTGIEIDYWVKANFQAVMSLVDALGGVEVDVPYAFCESGADRMFGESTVYVEKGLQTLDGKKALAFARNRHTWPEFCPPKYSKYFSNDFVRGQNQQLLVKAIMNKLKDIRSLTKVYKLLDVVGNNIETNVDKDTMISGFDVFKNIVFNSKNINSDDFVGTQRLYLSGHDAYINNIYYFEYSSKSLKEITDVMKVNLEKTEIKMDKEFDYSINKPYEDKQIGK